MIITRAAASSMKPVLPSFIVRLLSYRTIVVPVSPRSARSTFSGSVITARSPPRSRKPMTASIFGAMLPAAKGLHYESYVAKCWNDEQLIANGMMQA